MDVKTAEALEASILHWKENAVADKWGTASLGAGACALCGLFYAKACKGCPVAEASGAMDCQNTLPYHEASRAFRGWRRYEDDGTKFRTAAADMVEFLEGLRA